MTTSRSFLLVLLAMTLAGTQSFVTRQAVHLKSLVVRRARPIVGFPWLLFRPNVDEEAKNALSVQDDDDDESSFLSPINEFNPLTLLRKGPVLSSPTTASNDDEAVEPQQQSPREENDREMSLWAARGILLLVAAIWGTNFASVKYLEGLCFHPPCHHPPSEFAFARFGVAGLVSVPLLFRQRWDVILGGFECGLWITLGYVSQAMALATISSGKCAFICSLTVVFVPVVSALLYGRAIKRSDILAGLVAVSGVAILEGIIDVNNLLGIAPAVADVGHAAVMDTMTNTAAAGGAIMTTGLNSQADTSSSMQVAAGPIASLAASLGIDKGSLLALGQPIGFGFAFTRIEATQERFKDVPGRVLTIAAAQCVAVGILSFFWVLYDYDGVIPNFGYMIEWHRVATILWTGIVTTVFAIYLEGIALQKASATDASIAFSSEPVWASLFGYILLGETLGFNAYVGGTVIMSACLIGALNDLSSDGKGKDEDDDTTGLAP